MLALPHHGRLRCLNSGPSTNLRDLAMNDISGTTAIVTGAASGIGLGIATALAEAGANVVMADIQKDAASGRLSVSPVRTSACCRCGSMSRRNNPCSTL